MTFWQWKGKNETRLVGGERGSQSVGKMKFRKCEKACEKWRSWWGERVQYTWLHSKEGHHCYQQRKTSQWIRGLEGRLERNGPMAARAPHGQDKRGSGWKQCTTLLLQMPEELPQGPCLCPSYFPTYFLSFDNVDTRWAIHSHTKNQQFHVDSWL